MTLVIPARDAEATLGACLEAATPFLAQGLLREIVCVDDGSRDRTAEIAASFPVRRLAGTGAGPAAARNLGWRAAVTEWVWFVDSDCVAEPEALPLLLQRADDPGIGAVGGSYANLVGGSLLGWLIHEEIVERHRTMPSEVNFLATFNVLYRRAALEAVGGFDERFRKAQDAELAYRVRAAGWRLGFEARSRVGHFHETSLGAYLRVQAQQGFWRVWLYLEHPERAAGDSYSSPIDHLQPPVALLAGVSSPLVATRAWPLAALLAATLVALQVPMTLGLLGATRSPRAFAYLPFGAVRALARGIGMVGGAFARWRSGRPSRAAGGGGARAR